MNISSKVCSPQKTVAVGSGLSGFSAQFGKDAVTGTGRQGIATIALVEPPGAAVEHDRARTRAFVDIPAERLGNKIAFGIDLLDLQHGDRRQVSGLAKILAVADEQAFGRHFVSQFLPHRPIQWAIQRPFVDATWEYGFGCPLEVDEGKA